MTPAAGERSLRNSAQPVQINRNLPKPLAKVRVAHIGLSRGMTHVNDSLNLEFVEVVAVCDLREDRAKNAATSSGSSFP